MASTRNSLISNNFKQLKHFTMNAKQTFTLIAFVAALVCGWQTTNAQSWNLAGNSNATANSKLGTTNAIPVKLTTNNQTRLFVNATTGNISIGVGNLSDPSYR